MEQRCELGEAARAGVDHAEFVQGGALVQVWRRDSVTVESVGLVVGGSRCGGDGSACLAQAIEDEDGSARMASRLCSGKQLFGLFERGAEDLFPAAFAGASGGGAGVLGCASRPPFGLVPRPRPAA